MRGDCCHGVATGPLTGYVAGRLIRDVAATAASAKDEGPVRARTSAIPDESRSEPAVKRGFWRRSEPAARSPSVATLAFICRSTADCQDCTNGGIGVAPKRRQTTPSTARWVSPGFVALQGSAMDRERACNPRNAGPCETTKHSPPRRPKAGRARRRAEPGRYLCSVTAWPGACRLTGGHPRARNWADPEARAQRTSSAAAIQSRRPATVGPVDESGRAVPHSWRQNGR